MLEFDWLEFFIHHVIEQKNSGDTRIILCAQRKLMLFLNRQNIFHRQSLNVTSSNTVVRNIYTR